MGWFEMAKIYYIVKSGVIINNINSTSFFPNLTTENLIIYLASFLKSLLVIFIFFVFFKDRAITQLIVTS